MKQKIMVAMSGGVDSATAALFIKDAGYEVAGVTMKLYAEAEELRDCETVASPTADILDARAVCDTLSIPHFAVEYGESFRKSVIESFIGEYKNGGTPNPCVMCNRDIKFGKLLDFALSQGYDKIATGHYARIEMLENGRYAIKKAADQTKDQSYFLWSLTQEKLSHVLFPLGEMKKEEIRGIAKEAGFISAHKSDSQDICFIPDGDYISFIEKNTVDTFPEGDFIDLNGNVLGKHQGIIRYTVGQRKGLGIALGKPMFVGDKKVSENTVTLCDDADLYKTTLTAHSANFVAVEKLTEPTRLMAKIRYRHTPAWATVRQTSNTTFKVEFDLPQRAIARGQSVVLYSGDTLVGGGIIE